MKDLIEVVFCGANQKVVKLVLIPTGMVLGEILFHPSAGRFVDDELVRKIRGLYEKYIKQYI